MSSKKRTCKPKKKAASWQDYEQQKSLIAAKGLAPEMYEREIAKLVRKIGI